MLVLGKKIQNFNWAKSHLIGVYLCWPFVAFLSCILAYSMCSCIAHRCIVVLHAMCLSKCSSGLAMVMNS